MPDKKIVMRCNYCGNKTIFSLLSTHTHKEHDRVDGIGEVVYHTAW